MLMDELSADDLSLRRLDLADPATAADKALVLLSRSKNDLVTLENLRRRTEEDLERALSEEMRRCFEERLDLVELAERFERRRAERGLLRYEDMLELAAQVLSDPAQGAIYRGRYDLIVVDEFQDTNPAQMRFVELLAGGDLSRVVVVGDDLQSIYAFTGAEVRNIQRFELTAGLSVGDATYNLTTNFRSGRTILELANHIARQVHPENSPDEPKVLAPRSEAPEGEISAEGRAFGQTGTTEMDVADLAEVETLLEEALAHEKNGDDPTAAVFGEAAKGIARAATLLRGRYHLVATNVPYLGQGKQDEVLKDHLEQYHPAGKADLATTFLQR